ncbi:MAG: hypothetical protein ABI627_19050 [Polyangiaceae bacterium]
MTTHYTFVISMLVVASAVGCGGRANGGAGTSAAGSGGAGTSGGAGGTGSAGAHPTASCAPTTSDAGAAATDAAGAPIHHRASSCCSSQRGPGPSAQPYSAGDAARGADGGVACTSDAQCTDGANGRCFPFEGLVGPGGCSYDECATDSDCPSRTPCAGRAAATDNNPNVCASGSNCAVDADCGPGGYCSPSEDSCGAPGPYFCHTALDACVNDTDCPSVDGGTAGITDGACSYDAQARHWACNQRGCFLP